MKLFLQRIFFNTLILSILIIGCKNSPSGPTNPPDTNNAPTAKASSDSSTVTLNSTVQLDASSSTDADGDQLTYSWSLEVPSGSQTTLSATDISDPTFTPDAAGDYTATLTVSDGEADGTDDVTVTAQACPTKEITSDIQSDRTLKNICTDPTQTDYIVSGDRSVYNGAQLTIKPGVRIEFKAEASLQIDGDMTSISAVGTSTEPIVLTGAQKQAGSWKGIAIYSNNTANEMAYVEVAYGGGANMTHISPAANIALNNSTRLKLSNATVHHSAGFGLHADEGVNLTGFASNTFEENTKAPVSIPATASGYIDGASDFTNNTDSFVRVFNDNTITEDLTISSLAKDVPYHIEGTFYVENSAQLTIKAGAKIAFASQASMRIENGSSLTAVGTATEPILITGVQEQAGSWKGIGIYTNNTLNEMTHVEVAYGGGANMIYINMAAAIAIDNGARLKLSNATVHHSAGFGLHADEGVNLTGFAQNTIRQNTKAPVSIPATALGYIDGASDFTNNTNNFVRVFNDNTVTESLTMTSLSSDVPYHIEGTVYVNDTAQLTIEAGTEIAFESQAGLRIEGTSALIAKGTSTEPIVFTGVNKQAGSWKGIGIYTDNTLNEMSYVEVTYGGGSSMIYITEDANIGLDNNAQLKLTNSTVSNSGAYGVWADRDATLSASGNTYSGNASGDVGS